MSDPPTFRPLYLNGADGPIFAILHRAAGERRAVAVLLCPPFGWEDMCSYRSRREWARRLSAAGHPTLRIDLPGTGDSAGSPADPGRLAAWVDAVEVAAAWLRASTGCARVAAVGIGLGGLVAARAAGIDDLALWGVPARGRGLVRELRAFSRLEAAELGDEAIEAGGAAATPDGALVVAGYPLTAETIRDLEAIDLSHDPPVCDRVLLLGRDGRPADPRLRAALEASGATVEADPGEGYAAMMMTEPSEALPSLEVLDRLLAWLDVPEGAAPAAVTAPPELDSVELEVDGTRIRETPLVVAHPFGQLFGVLSEPVGPAAGVVAVLLNAAALRRTGPNRMWVDMSRRWAARGVPVLRVDLAGIGDADGDDSRFVDYRAFYVHEYLEQVTVALDALEARGLPGRVALGGLCVGGYWSVQAALDDHRVVCALALNPGALVYDEGLEYALQESRGLLRKLLSVSDWRRVLGPEVRLSDQFRRLRSLLGLFRRAPRQFLRRRQAGADPLDEALDRLRDADRRALMVFAGGEPVYADLEREGRLGRFDRWPNVALHHLPVSSGATATNVHMLRAPSLQAQVHRLVDEALERELERSAPRSLA